MTMKQAGVVLVTSTDNQVLVVWNRELLGWTLPGGKVDPGETPIEAAVRELREETGLVAQTENLRPFYRAMSGRDGDREVHIFRVLAFSGIPHMAEEGSPVKWTGAADLLIDGPYREFYEKMFREVARDRDAVNALLRR